MRISLLLALLLGWSGWNELYSQTDEDPEVINAEIIPEHIAMSKWTLILGKTTPFNILSFDKDKRKHWSIYAGIARKMHRFYSGMSWQLGFQPFYYQHKSEINVLSSIADTRFEQKWKLGGIESFLGLNLVFAHKKKISPIVSGGMILLLPLQHKRELMQSDSTANNPGLPIFITSSGGMKPSLGLYYRFGLSYQASPRLRLVGHLARDLIFLTTNFKGQSVSARKIFAVQDNIINAGEWFRWEAQLHYAF